MSLCGARLADSDTWPRNFPSRLPGYLLIGCVVAVMEEMLLRGGVQGALQRICKLPTAVVFASGIYSIVHYIKPSRAPMVEQMNVTWLAGFECLAQALQRTLTERSAIVGIVTLFLAGCVLGLAFARTKALYLSIGVHAGWVATLKSYSHFTDANKHPSELARWLGTGSIIESIVSWPVLMLLIVVMIYWRRPKNGK